MVLKQVHELASAQEIHNLMRSTDGSGAPGLTTVYRALESLVGMSLVQTVDLGDGERRFELVEPGEHHHHLICDVCRKSIHLDSCVIEDLDKSVRTRYGFQIRTHVLEIFGTCKKCRQSSSVR